MTRAAPCSHSASFSGHGAPRAPTRTGRDPRGVGDTHAGCGDTSSSPKGLRRKSYAFWRLKTSLVTLGFPRTTMRNRSISATSRKPFSTPKAVSSPPSMGGKGFSPQPQRRRISYLLLAAVDLPLLLRRQREHGLSVLVREVEFILETGKKPTKHAI